MSEGYKKCPYCNRVIMGNATECKHCGASLGGGGSNNAANDGTNYASYGSDDFSFVEGLTYMFTDKAFITKFLGLFLVSLIVALVYLAFIPTMAVNSQSTAEILKSAQSAIWNGLFMMATGSLILGYQLSCIKSITAQSGDYNLPAIRFMDDFWAGLKYFLSMYLFMIPFVICMMILMFVLAFLGPLALVVPVMYFIFAAALAIFMPAFMWIFAQRRYWSVFFKWRLLNTVLQYGYARYAKVLFFMFLYGVCFWIIALIVFFMFGKMLLTANLIILAIIYSLVMTYSIYVASYCLAKSISADKIRYLP